MKRIALFLSVGAVVMLLASGAMAKPTKVDVCHIPPGNPDNAHTISVGARAVPAHLAHGDTLGACDDGPCTVECALGQICDDGECVSCFSDVGDCCLGEECIEPGICFDGGGECFLCACFENCDVTPCGDD